MISILIGRNREQQRSLELLDDSKLSAGARRLIQLDGAIGVGKSSLLAYALAHRSDPLFLIHGDRFTADGPLVAHRTMIEQLLDQNLEALLHESTPQLLAVRCANALDTAPVLIAVDDAQWLDPASEEFLTQLMLSPTAAPLTILLVHRKKYEPTALISAARRRGAIHEHFTLPELPDTAITELVAGLQPTQIRAVVEAAQGNPLFARAARAGFQRHPKATRIHEVLRLEHNSQSSVLSAVITDDVTTVSDPARTVLQTMAIMGPSSDEAKLRAVAELNAKTYDNAVAELTFRGLIDLSAHENMHPVVRYSTYQNTDPQWLIQAHRRAAHYCEDEMLTKAEHLAHIAGHLDAAEAALLVEAAGLAIGSEPHTALRWLSDIPAQYRDETAELLLARAETLNGQHQQAAQRLRSLQRRSDTDEVRIQLANVLRISGEYEEARALLSSRGSTRDGKVMREALDVYGLLDGRAPEHLVTELATLPGDENRISAATYRTMDYLSDGKVPAARDSFAGVSSWMLAAEMQTLRPMLHAVACAGWCAYMLDEFTNGAAIAARGLKIARRFGQADVVANLGAGLAFNRVQLAQFPEVEGAATQAVDDAQRYGPAGVEAMARAALLIAAQANPDREVLRQRYAELKATPIPEFSWWRRAVLTTLTRASALLGEPQPAPDLLSEPHDVMAPLRHADAALVAAVSGNLDVALALLKDGIAIAQRQDSQGQRAMLEVTQAEILFNTGDVVESAKLFTSAQAVFQRLGMALQIGRARAGLASIEHQRKQQPDPLQHLTKREREIAQLVAQGLTNKNIAEHLTISRRTVENHTANIMRKLGAASRHGIVAQLHGENAQ